MNSLKFKFQLFAALALALFLSPINSSYCSIVIDIEMTPSPKGEHYLCVVAFDTKRQTLLHHETLAPAEFERPLASFASGFNQSAPQDAELSHNFSFKQDVTFWMHASGVMGQAQVSKESYIILCPAQIMSGTAVVSVYNQFLNKHVWYSRPIQPKTPEEMSQLIQGTGDKHGSEGDFFLMRHDTRNMHALSSLTNGKKGNFGEQITRMTMFSYGYDFFPSIYSGNQGLDGIFLSICRQYMVLSQSKVGNSNPMAGTVIKNELNEPHINERLKLMLIYGAPAVKASRLLVLKHIKERPYQIYKLAQTLFDCGHADLMIQDFEPLKFPMENIQLFGLTDADKMTVVKRNLDAIEENPLKQMEFAIASIDLSGSPKKAVLRAFINKMGFDQNTQMAMLNLLAEGETE
jgi:hypothetical protein